MIDGDRQAVQYRQVARLPTACYMVI